jgi:hypothetical protein
MAFTPVNGFTTRRDSSVNNVPVVGYQDSADAQDVILWAPCQVTDTVNTDSTGMATVLNAPIIDVSHDWVTDGQNVPRQRKIDSKDITAKDANNNTLYVGAVNGALGQVMLYTDSGLTTAAVNKTGVQVTYWTMKPVQVNSQGQLVVSLASGSISATLSGALPAGSNNIGSVNVASLPAIPAGTNTIGNVQLLDSAGAGLKAMGYTSGDGLAVVSNPLATSSLPWLYNGDGTASRVRNSRYFHNQTFTASGPANFWTPASGKAVALRGWLIVSNAPCNFNWRVNGVDIAPTMTLTAGTPMFVELPNIWIVGSANQILGVDITNVGTVAVGSTLAVGVLAWGTEE